MCSSERHFISTHAHSPVQKPVHTFTHIPASVFYEVSLAKDRMEPIAIVGSACRFPGDATSPSKLWDLLKDPHDLSQEVKRFNAKGFYHENGHYHGATNAIAGYTLEDDPMQFDPQFFSIQPGEAESMDPQHRLLLETTYEGLESAGIPVETLRGSDTSAFIGVMSADYTTMVFFDSECTPTYSATGTSRAILSNRLSHTFDWHGASMTIDTACSSSLVAIHLAVRELRSNSSRVAVAGGTNLMLSADPFISETNLDMLSPDGRCHMWDARANGYARGEGIAVVVLKKLCDALADGDHIECIIRETGINQDGYTPGITMPNPKAQTRLIRDVYSRAGLDLSKEEDRCQYFEAHGTGTKAGDAVESRAIHETFFPELATDSNPLPSLYVGSIKTIIGHTEGTAGVAGVLRASLAIQNGTIPPNLHFQSLNPELKPYYGNLKIATEAAPWPSTHGSVRRASVNSFGFGGANCHVILEGYPPSYRDSLPCLGPDSSTSSSDTSSICSTEAPSPASSLSRPSSVASMDSISRSNVIPFLLSASSEKTLRRYVKHYVDYLGEKPPIGMASLAWTLFKNKSALPIRLATAAPTAAALEAALVDILSQEIGDPSSPISRVTAHPGRLVGVFTGQGAQWPTMGRQLVMRSKVAETTLDRLESALACLPEAYRPTWSLKAQLLADKASSRIEESAISQPLCTAVQIILVVLIRIAGIDFDAVVGHSSGEIAAAYAAGFISAEDAIKIAYTRGLCAHLANGQAGEAGGMIAAAMSRADAEDLCSNEAVLGRISVAAYNSPSSVTLSGDKDVVEQVSLVLDDEEKFNRVLRVQTAYHSHHMEPCVGRYREALAACAVSILTPARHCPWFSSVYGGREVLTTDNLAVEYWVNNMVQPVLFADAVSAAAAAGSKLQPHTLAWAEIGPHPALKSPAMETIKSLKLQKVVYGGTLSRGKDDIDAMAGFLGWLWSACGQTGLALDQYAAQFSPDALVPIRQLPSYPWDHDNSYEFEARESHAHRFREMPPHRLLGVPTNSSGDKEYRWKNFLSTEEIPWLTGHQIQGQTLVPAAMFLVMAVEAATMAAGALGHQVHLVELYDSVIHRALALADDKSTETLFYLSEVAISSNKTEGRSIFSANYHCNVATPKSSSRLSSVASGRIKLTLGGDGSPRLPRVSQDSTQLDEIDVKTFYDNLWGIGYHYSGSFQGITSLKRTTNWATGIISAPVSTDPSTTSLLVPLHPAVLDVSFQAVFAALSYPGDGGLQTLHVPTTIKRLTVSPEALLRASTREDAFVFSAVSYIVDKRTICGDINVGTSDASHEAAFRVEGMTVTPVSPPTAEEDKRMFADMALCTADPSTALLSDELEKLHLGRSADESLAIGTYSADKVHACQVVANLLKQITLRYPQARVLERIADDMTDVLSVFATMRPKISSYTLDGTSEEEFTAISDSQDDGFGLKRISLQLDNPSFAETTTSGEYDVAILGDCRADAGQVLKALRHVIRPGGYLLSIHAQDMAGCEESLEPWDTRFTEAGFSGIETQMLSSHGRFSIMATMAVDDTIMTLRQPRLSSSPKISRLLIIGGNTAPTARFTTQIRDLLGPFCQAITTVKSFNQLDLSSLAEKPFILSLTELDTDFYRCLSEDTFSKLQELTARSDRIVWVVSGARGRNPYANMIKGTFRCLLEEFSDLKSQILDIEDDIMSALEFISDSVLRFHHLHSIKLPGQILWSHEPELHLINGNPFISRYLPNKNLDLGYNSLRRNVHVEAPAASLLQISADKSALSLQRLRVPDIPSMESGTKTHFNQIDVRFSLSVCVHVPGVGYLYPVTGVNVQTGQVVAALSTENRSRIAVSAETLVPLVGLADGHERLLPATLQTVFQAWSIVQRCPPGTTVVAHEASDTLAQMLVDAGIRSRVQFIFTSCDESRCDRRGENWKFIARYGSTRQLIEVIKPDTMLCIDCAEAGSGYGIADMGFQTPPGTAVLAVNDFLRAQSYRFSGTQDDVMLHTLKMAVDTAASLEVETGEPQCVDMIDVQDLPLEFASGIKSKVISWSSKLPVRASVLPALEECHFSPDKTYFLVGMAGSLGVSTVSYMISRGARHFALSSRNPTVDTAWIASQKAKYGAIINTFAL